MATMIRSREDIERDMRTALRGRDLIVSPGGVNKLHAQLDAYLDEWEQAEKNRPLTRATAPAEPA